LNAASCLSGVGEFTSPFFFSRPPPLLLAVWPRKLRFPFPDGLRPSGSSSSSAASRLNSGSTSCSAHRGATAVRTKHAIGLVYQTENDREHHPRPARYSNYRTFTFYGSAFQHLHLYLGQIASATLPNRPVMPHNTKSQIALSTAQFHGSGLELKHNKAGVSLDDSRRTGVHRSQSPSYATHAGLQLP
jgi:hypothetical protein